MDLTSASTVLRSLNHWMGAREAIFLYRAQAEEGWEAHPVLEAEDDGARVGPAAFVPEGLPTAEGKAGPIGAEDGVGLVVQGHEAFLTIPTGRSRGALAQLGLYLRFATPVGEAERAGMAQLKKTLGVLMASEGRYRGFVNEMESLLQILTHDLKSPANAVAGFVDIVLEDYGPSLDGSLTELLARIRSSAGRLQGILDGVYKIRRATFVPLRASVLSLRELAEDAFERVRLAYREVPVELSLPEGLPDVVVDAEKMEFALGAVFDNAFKFRQKAQVLRVSLRYEALGDGAHSLLLEDNSMGFEARFASAVFEPFRRLHPPGEYAGAGVGLAVARICIDAHEGEIRVVPALGEGVQTHLSFRELPPPRPF